MRSARSVASLWSAIALIRNTAIISYEQRQQDLLNHVR